MKKNLLFLVLLTQGLIVAAQHQEINEKPALGKEKESETDSTSILSAFRRGTMSGHFRYYFMSTQNKVELTDYYAHAAGGGIKFETGRFKNFQLGVSGFSELPAARASSWAVLVAAIALTLLIAVKLW